MNDTKKTKAKKSRGVMPVSKGMEKFMRKHKSFFCDTNGQLVFAQAANTPLKLWFISMGGRIVSRLFIPSLYDFFSICAFLSIGWWAIWEITDGVCPWRRFLGAAVLALDLVSVYRFLT